MTYHPPLAVTLRPKTLDDVVGQDHLLGEDAKFRRLIESGKLASILLFGPAGTGKTTIAEIIATHTQSKFVRLNSTQASVKEIRKYGKIAEDNDERITIFTDEIHRMSTVQQDALLPFSESGHVAFIGATTENPFFSVTSALLSRAQMVCELEPLKSTHLAILIKRIVEYYKTIDISPRLSKEAILHIINVANGDARRLISIMEVAVEVADDHESPDITLELAKSVSPSKHMVFGAQAHFDYASAFQGSIQASDANAAIYWLAAWLESGEDPRYIARRLLVSAAEDAFSNPACTAVAHAAYTAACKVGRPECDIVMAQATIMIAQSVRDKTAANAVWAAVRDVREGGIIEVPKEMKDSHYKSAAKLGHGNYHDGANPESYVGIDKIYVQEKSDEG